MALSPLCCTVLERGQALGFPQAPTSLQGVPRMGCAWVQPWPVIESSQQPGWGKGTHHWQGLQCLLSVWHMKPCWGTKPTYPRRQAGVAQEITLRHQGKMFKPMGSSFAVFLSSRGSPGVPSRQSRLGPGTARDAGKEQM